jgi:hypothetical protein
MEPTDSKNDADLTNGGAVNPTQVQLSSAQMEEAREMTKGKLRQFRRDRLYANDRDRMLHLTDMLKKSRVIDDQTNAIYNLGIGSPSKNSKNWDNSKTASTNKSSPNKNQQVSANRNKEA